MKMNNGHRHTTADEEEYEVESCSVASVSTIDQGHRMAQMIIDGMSTYAKSTLQSQQPIAWHLDDDEGGATSASSTATRRTARGMLLDIDERSDDDAEKVAGKGEHEQIHIDEDCSTQAQSSRPGERREADLLTLVDELDTNESNDKNHDQTLEEIDFAPTLKRPRHEEEEDNNQLRADRDAHFLELDERSSTSSSNGKRPLKNYSLPKLPVADIDDEENDPNRTTKSMGGHKPKTRKLGPMSAELARRIHAQKSAQTLSKFRAFHAVDDQKLQQAEEEDPLAEFPDSNVVASAWGVDMIESRINPERVIFRKSGGNK